MIKQLPGETLSQYAIRVAWFSGNFWNPDNPEGFNVAYNDLKNLKPTDDVVVRAMISMSKMDASRYTRHVLEKHSRPPVFDGVIGPAIEAMVTDGVGRCPVPDYAPPTGVSFLFEDPYVQEVALRMQKNATLPALGVGNWKSCHGVGNFHSAIVRVNPAGMPAFLSPVFKTVLQRVQRAYAEIGLLFRFVQNGIDLLTAAPIAGTANTDLSFVSSSSGWIGLALVGQNETCGSTIWCRFLATYKGGQTDQDVITQWTSLIKHELGHNCGRGHTSGGVMNPSIVNNLPELWAPEDPSTSWLKSQFGGQPVQIPGGTPVPNPNPNPPSDLQKQIDALQIGHTVQQVTIDWLIRKVNSPS